MKNNFKINAEYSNTNREIYANINYKSIIEEFKAGKLIDIFGEDIQKMENFTQKNSSEIKFDDYSGISKEGLVPQLKPINNFPDREKDEEIFIRNNNNYLVYLIILIIGLIFLIIYMVIKIKKKTKQDDINRINNFYKKSYELRIKEYECTI